MPCILVVDDDPLIRELLADALEAAGYSVNAAANGLEALATIARRKPDAIVLDLMMPEMDGATFARTCHETVGCAGIPIMLLSAGRDLAAAAEHLAPFGVRAALAKPFQLGELVGHMEHLTAQPV